MNRLATKIKPKHGYSHLLHLVLTAAMPVLLYILVRASFTTPAIAVLLLSKWRMFAVRPRYWIANIRGNAIDIIVGISVIYFMTYADAASWQLLWVGLYAVWLVVVKPKSSMTWVSLQALIGQTAGLFSLYLIFPDAPLAALVVAHWFIAYYAARHFFVSFDEEHARFLAMMWALFAASLGWLLGHWLLFYSVVSQPTLLLTVLGFGLSGLYYLDHHDKLSTFLRRQFLFVMTAVVAIVLIFSNWAERAP